MMGGELVDVGDVSVDEETFRSGERDPEVSALRRDPGSLENPGSCETPGSCIEPSAGSDMGFMKLETPRA